MTPFIEAAQHQRRRRCLGQRRSRYRPREIKFDEAVTGIATGDLVNALKQGEYAIYFRGYKANEGIIEADVRSVTRSSWTLSPAASPKF
jgi:L-seryl-tRNA(Ser) seleniumtransferase